MSTRKAAPEDDPEQRRRILEDLRVAPGARADIEGRPSLWSGVGEYESLSEPELKASAKAVLERGIKRLSDAQELLWASDTHSLLVVFQAMDAAGKDSTIEHVMSGVNPQGVQVVSFKQPSSEELDHAFLWRIQKNAPERGRIGIFNRSQYEEVIALRVHPDWLDKQRLPDGDRGESFWADRFDDLNAFERHLDRNGTKVVKLFLHVSKAEQKKRFMARLDNPDKLWKFNAKTSPNGPTGTSTWPPTRTRSPRRPPRGPPGTSCPPTTSTSCRPSPSRSSSTRSKPSTSGYPTVSDKDRERNAEARRLLEAEPPD